MDSTQLRTTPFREKIFSSKARSEFLLPHKQEAVREALDHLFITEKYGSRKADRKKPVEKSGVCIACTFFTTNKCRNCHTFICDTYCHPGWRRHTSMCRGSPPSKFKSPPKKNLEANEKLMINTNSSPFQKLTQQFRNASGQNYNNNKVSGRKSEPPMSNNSFTRNRSNSGRRRRQKRHSTGETDSRPMDRHSFGRNNQNKSFQRASSSSAETESASTSFSKFRRHGLRNQKLNFNTNGVLFERSNLKKVIMFHRDPNSSIYWVMNQDDFTEFESIHKALSKECDGYEPIKPELGLVCGCKYMDEWYRARVLALEPECRVHYIDYGNSAEADPFSLKKLPPEIRMVKNLVYRIEFDESTPEIYKKKDLKGKVLKIEVMLINVMGVEVVKLILDGSELEASDSGVTKKGKVKAIRTKKIIRSSMSLIKRDSKGEVWILPETSKMRFGLNIPEGCEEEIELDVEEAKSLHQADLIPIKPVENEYVLVIDCFKQRRRGKVISTLCSTYYVLLIDYGIIVAVENVYRLPGRETNLIHLGVNVVVNEILYIEKMRNMKKCLYQVTGDQDSEGKWPCELLDSSSKEVLANGYIRSPPEEGVTVPSNMPIESGMICELSVVTGVKNCYVRPLDEETARKNLEMSVKMSEFLLKARPLTQPPEIGKMYAAKNKKDDCFHRVLIKSLKKDKYRVFFVDYGTVEEVEMEDLKPLPIGIKVVPFFAVEVTLSGITIESLTKDAKEYLDRLIEENTTLVLNFDGIESDDVILMENISGAIVNEMIENARDYENIKYDERDKCDKTGKQEKADINDKNDQSDKSSIFEKNDIIYKQDKSDRNGKNDQSDKSSIFEKNDIIHKQDKSDRNGKNDQSDKSSIFEKNDIIHKQDKSDRNGKNDQSDKSGKLEKNDIIHKQDKSDRNGKKDQGDRNDKIDEITKEEDVGIGSKLDWRWKKYMERKKFLNNAEDLITKKDLKLPNIRANEKYNLILQYIDEDEFRQTLTFWMADSEDDTFSQVSNVVSSRIEQYCNEERQPYRPKKHEMCLATYEGDWYRALTLDVQNDIYHVFFVDFGNTCSLGSKGIRKMKREFMEHPAWAFKCIISGVGKLIGKPELKRTVYNELRRSMNSVLKNVLVTKREFEIHYVAIPHIEKMLLM